MAWGGAAWDPKNGFLIVPTNRLASVVHLIPREKFDAESQVKGRLSVEFAPQHGTPYGMSREFLFSPGRCPCNAPPWGALSAVDTNTGKIAWEVPLGKLPWLEGHKDAAQMGLDQSGRSHHYGQRAGLHWSDTGSVSPCVRNNDRKGTVEGKAPSQREIDANDLSVSEGQTVCSDLGQWS